MSRIKKKFANAARDINRLRPHIDSPLWNFYANAFHNGEAHTITLPVNFYKSEAGAFTAPIARAEIECLPSPYLLNVAAIKTLLQDKKNRGLDFKWTHLTINHGPMISAEDIAKTPYAKPVQKTTGSVRDLMKAYYKDVEENISTPTIADRVSTSFNPLAKAEERFSNGLFAHAHQFRWTQHPPRRGPASYLKATTHNIKRLFG